MPAPAPRLSSAGRTARASVEVWLLTVVAHTVAGGALPSLPWLVGVAGLVTASTAWVLRRSVRLTVMLPVLALCQLGLHALFATLSPAGAAVGHAPAHAPGHALHAAAPTAWWMDELSPRMVVAHVLCAVLTGVVWWLRRWVVDVVLSLARPLTVAMRPAEVAMDSRASLGAALVWLVGSPGRAPPCAPAPA